jgi:ACT domain-containing protein
LQRCREDGNSRPSINIPDTLFKSWLLSYERYGSPEKAFAVHHPRGWQITPAAAWVIKSLKDNHDKSRLEAVERVGVSQRTINRWIRRYRLFREFRQSIDKLVENNSEGAAINALQKSKVNAEVLSKLVQEKAEALLMTMNAKADSIKQLVSFGMSVLKACQVFNVCRSTYYRHLKPRKEKDSSLVQAIRNEQVLHSYVYRAKRMARFLSMRQETPINHKRVARLMRENNLNFRVRLPRFKRCRLEPKIPDSRPCIDKLNREFFHK